MYVQLPETDALYVARVSGRIVRMFQRYARNIDPESGHFLAFITEYLAGRNVKNPEAMPYSELYRHIKNGIREYLHLLESGEKANVPAKKSE
jgi:hypothetical protein